MSKRLDLQLHYQSSMLNFHGQMHHCQGSLKNQTSGRQQVAKTGCHESAYAHHFQWSSSEGLQPTNAPHPANPKTAALLPQEVEIQCRQYTSSILHLCLPPWHHQHPHAAARAAGATYSRYLQWIAGVEGLLDGHLGGQLTQKSMRCKSMPSAPILHHHH